MISRFQKLVAHSFITFILLIIIVDIYWCLTESQALDWERFLFFFFSITDSFSLLMIGLFKLCFFFSFGGLYISRNLSVSFRLSDLLACNCTWYPLNGFCISVVWAVLLVFCSFGSSLSLVRLVRAVSLVYPWRGTTLVLFFLVF